MIPVLINEISLSYCTQILQLQFEHTLHFILHISFNRMFSPECSYLCLASELCLEKTLAHWSHAYIPSSASILWPFQLLLFFFKGLSSSSNESSKSICTSSASICQQIIIIIIIIIIWFCFCAYLYSQQIFNLKQAFE